MDVYVGRIMRVQFTVPRCGVSFGRHHRRDEWMETGFETSQPHDVLSRIEAAIDVHRLPVRSLWIYCLHRLASLEGGHRNGLHVEM